MDYEQQHHRFLRKNGAECALFLKCNGDFPLPKVTKVALYGSGARNTLKGGTGSGEVNSRMFVSIYDGLRKSGIEIVGKSWLKNYDKLRKKAKADFIKDIKKSAGLNPVKAIFAGMGAVMPEPEYELPIDGSGDVGIYVLSRISGEGNDRKIVKGDFLLTDTEIRDILTCAKFYPKFMLVLNVGGPVDLSPILPHVENILLLSQLGDATGRIFVDILTGKSNPSGKLATTWPMAADELPGEFAERDDTRYQEGIYVGYRYYDSVSKTPMFPFGYGKSYTTFAMDGFDAAMNGPSLTLTACVTNTGSKSGKEVLQVYVSKPWGKLDQPYQELAGFAKTSALEPGQSERLQVTFSLQELASFDESISSYILESGDYIVRAGASSADTKPVCIVRIEGNVIVRKVKDLLGNPGFTDWKPETRREDEPRVLPILAVAPAQIPVSVPNYNPAEPVDPLIEELSDEELAYLSMGTFNPKDTIGSMMGEGHYHVAGVAGETTCSLEAKGIPVISMADGPAGLRLSPQYFEDKKGIHSVNFSLIGGMEELLPPIIRPMLSLMTPKPKKDTVIKEQYASAIPIGTAIAQSFNEAFAAQLGDLVGQEMEQFGVGLWLAPALNIHRNVLCGRNFEYFSEDPLVSGRIAAAISRGVQAHPGCGVTIKHYAANNQETNRYNNSSQVSKRAMRELYLKGFEICVREGKPMTVMTSYNLLNGEHTSERRDLIQDILRGEFGFDGVVMTDWVIAAGMNGKDYAYPRPFPAQVAAAGGDLFMPGSKADYKLLMEGIKEGVVSRKQLRVNATRVARLAKTLAEGKALAASEAENEE